MQSLVRELDPACSKLRPSAARELAEDPESTKGIMLEANLRLGEKKERNRYLDLPIFVM